MARLQHAGDFLIPGLPFSSTSAGTMAARRPLRDGLSLGSKDATMREIQIDIPLAFHNPPWCG